MPISTADQPIVGAYGDIYTADVGTPIPTVLDTPGASWTKLGMVSEDGCSWTPPEEETEDIKIWQSPYPARTVTTGLTSSLAFALDEWDRESVPFALGGGSFEDAGTTVIYHPPGPGESEMKAIYVYVKDGDVKMGIYFAKGRVISRDDSVFKPDEAALLNVEFGLLVDEGNDPYNLVFDSATFPAAGGGGVAATGATEVDGAAGTWKPTGANVPANLAAMTGITAYDSNGTTPSGSTPWVTDSHMVTFDNQHCHWSGSAWVTGDAA
jgi:hypothetical protein